MGDHEDLPKSNGLLMPNGLRPSEAAATVTRTLDAERWSLVEERTSELIARIQPNKPSEERRIAVANYVQQLIKKCFPCQVFTFGSVPLKTYLPDGDIDLTTFSKNLDLKDTWANEVREILEHEEKSEDAEFCVKEVQYIKAEVKIIKCLVENIVVDISFNQLGGLCTLCFLEEIDHLINQDHLFKRSIILIKAWCYYESRILGAHHGLLSTYALETLVLYIFHVFNNSFAGPLEVLYRFLEFFSKFDWENFCVSLWGPVPISSLPDTTAEPPRKDGGDLLLSRIFLDACSAVYAVFPSGHDTQGQPFVSKHFNVIDPLRINNNLGRSVSKGNFYRIRSAFAFGAKRLAGLLECPKEDIIAEVDKFFANTRQRHGSGNRPDAPASIPLQPQPPNSDPNQALESCKNQGNTRKKTETARLRPGHQFLTVASASLSDSLSQQVISGSQNPPNVNRTTSPSGSQSQKAYSCQTSYRVLDQIAKNISSNETVHKERFKSHSKPCQFSNDYVGHGKLQFARTHSSPELSDTSAQILSRSRRSVPDNGKNHFISSKPNINSRKTFGPDVLGCQNARLVNDSLSPKYTSSHQNCIPTPDSNCIPNNFHDNTGFATTGEELASASQALEMHQEEQDMVNMMSSPRVNGLVQQLQLPISFTTHQFPVPSPILRPVGYSQKNIGVIPANVPVAPWPPQFSQGFVPPSLSSYFSNAQLETSSEEALESGNDASSMTELNQEDADHGCWPEQETASSVGFIPPDRNFQIFNSNDKKGPCGGFDFIPLSQISNPNVPFMRDHAKIARENINMDRSSHDDPTMHQNMTETDVYTSNRSTDTKLHASWGSSSRSMVADSWDGPSIKAPKLPRDRWGRKPASSAASSTSYGNTKSWRQYEDSSLDHASISRDDDIGEWIKESSSSNEVAEPSDSMSQICGSQPPPGPEPTLMSGSDSGLPVAPMFLCTGPRQRSGNSSGSVFYPTGPPVPFYMLPVYKIPSDSGASDGTLEQLNGLDANWSNPLVRDVDSNEKSEQAEVPVSTSVIDDASSEPFVERKSDILNGDFSSHWQNLQYGRLCQDPSVPGPPIYPAPIVVPPMYFQGHYPLDGPGRAFSANANLLPVMSYSPRILQVMPLQAGSVRHSELFQRYGDEAPSFRGGTGTFLPKAKIPLRARPPGTRNHRASYNYDRSDHGDREGSWKSRVPNRGHGNGQHDKPNTRPDRLPAVDNRTDRSWDSHKNERAILNHQNNSLSSTWPSHGPANMTYGMYPIASMNSHNAHPSGTPIPSFVMLYSYNHPNLGYGSSSEPVEFGSLGPMHLSSINEVQPPNNGGVPRNAFEPRHETCQQGSECSSPDQPSSPHIRRRV